MTWRPWMGGWLSQPDSPLVWRATRIAIAITFGPLVAFSVIASAAFIYAAEPESISYDFPWVWWSYYFCCSDDPDVWAWLLITGIPSALVTALIPLLILRWMYRQRRSLARQIPARSSNYGRARLATKTELAETFKVSDR